MHVFSDLMPYICTFDGCPNKLRCFPSRSAWANHEFQEHRFDRYWACPECPEKSCSTLDWEYHINSVHSQKFSGPNLVSARNAACRISPKHAEEEECPLCRVVLGKPRRAFVKHVSRHMEDIALMALPSNAEEDSEIGSISTNRTSNEDNDTSKELHIYKTVVKCICGLGHNGGDTVQCERCNFWQHTPCYYLNPDHYSVGIDHFCVDCNPRPLDSRIAIEQQVYLRAEIGPDAQLMQPNEQPSNAQPSPSPDYLPSPERSPSPVHVSRPESRERTRRPKAGLEHPGQEYSSLQNNMPNQHPFITQSRRQSSGMGSGASDQAPEFPASLTSMEPTKSESGQRENVHLHAKTSQRSAPSSQEAPAQRPTDIFAGSGIYVCEALDCYARFETSANLVKHRRDNHRAPSPGSEIYVCTASDCYARFKTSAKLFKHRRDNHRAPSPYKALEARLSADSEDPTDEDEEELESSSDPDQLLPTAVPGVERRLSPKDHQYGPSSNERTEAPYLGTPNFVYPSVKQAGVSVDGDLQVLSPQEPVERTKRRRRRFTPMEKAEIAARMKTGACDDCRRRKTKVSLPAGWGVQYCG